MTGFTQNCSTMYQNGSTLEETGRRKTSTPEETGRRETSTPEEDDFDDSNFIVLRQSGLMDFVSMVSQGKLQNRDLIVLMIYVIHTDWRTGRCRITAGRVSEILGYQLRTLYPSVKRLKEQDLLVPIKDSRTGEKLHLVSPHFMRAGSGRAKGFLLKTYYDAICRNKPIDSLPAGDTLNSHSETLDQHSETQDVKGESLYDASFLEQLDHSG